jgi:hypothetical protein
MHFSKNTYTDLLSFKRPKSFELVIKDYLNSYQFKNKDKMNTHSRDEATHKVLKMWTIFVDGSEFNEVHNFSGPSMKHRRPEAHPSLSQSGLY